MGAVLWFIPAVLLLASVALALTDIQAYEDPADPTASVSEACGSVLSPDSAGTGQAAERHIRVCEPARSARQDRAVLFLAAGTAAAVLVAVLQVRAGHRRSSH